MRSAPAMESQKALLFGCDAQVSDTPATSVQNRGQKRMLHYCMGTDMSEEVSASCPTCNSLRLLCCQDSHAARHDFIKLLFNLFTGSKPLTKVKKRSKSNIRERPLSPYLHEATALQRCHSLRSGLSVHFMCETGGE